MALFCRDIWRPSPHGYKRFPNVVDENEKDNTAGGPGSRDTGPACSAGNQRAKSYLPDCHQTAQGLAQCSGAR